MSSDLDVSMRWPAGAEPLTHQELLTLSGGGTLSGPLGELLKHLATRALDCLIDDWDTLVDCFNDGRAAASR